MIGAVRLEQNVVFHLKILQKLRNLAKVKYQMTSKLEFAKQFEEVIQDRQTLKTYKPKLVNPFVC